MKIPRYWTRIEHTLQGKTSLIKTHLYGWSDTSQGDAEQCARRRASTLVQTPSSAGARSWYQYDRMPIREEILEEHSFGDSHYLITRSRYGAKILNSDSVGFIDLDVNGDSQASHRTAPQVGFLARLFGKKDPFLLRLEELKKWFINNPRVGMRLYRTTNGYRGIFTHSPLRPSDVRTTQLLEELHSDPLYVRLCREQECFRARLTPKPWRIGVDTPRTPGELLTTDGNWKTLPQFRNYLHQLKDYDEQSTEFAACSFLEHLGNERINSEIRPILELHDTLSGALTGKPLA